MTWSSGSADDAHDGGQGLEETRRSLSLVDRRLQGLKSKSFDVKHDVPDSSEHYIERNQRVHEYDTQLRLS